MIKRTVTKFSSFEAAESADIELYQKMSYQEKLAELLEILKSQSIANETEQRLQRVYRIIKLS